MTNKSPLKAVVGVFTIAVRLRKLPLLKRRGNEAVAAK
jgi:hypothetical protein